MSTLILNRIPKIQNAEIKMTCFQDQIAKISNRRNYPLYGMQSFDGGDTVRILWSFDGNRNTLYSRFIMRGFDGGDLNPLPEEGLHGRLGLDYWLHGGCKNNTC